MLCAKTFRKNGVFMSFLWWLFFSRELNKNCKKINCHVRLRMFFFSLYLLFVFVCAYMYMLLCRNIWVVPFYLRLEVKRSRNDSLKTVLKSILRTTFNLLRISSEFRFQSTENSWIRMRIVKNEWKKRILFLALIQI